MFDVAICILTYRRNEGLTRLFHGLRRLTFHHHSLPSIKVVVVDNDPEGGATSVIDKEKERFPWPVVSRVEFKRGISYARNTAISMAISDSKLIAFIDDDEIPEPQWLDELLAVQRKYQAEIVAGPVLPMFPDNAPSWSVKGGFYHRRRYPTGHVLPFAASGNVLMSSSMLAGMSSWFDNRFALTGGEDTHFFMRLVQIGMRIVWADNAVAYESVPASRLKLQWLLRRSYRTGITFVQCEKELMRNGKQSALRLCKALGRIAQGITTLPASLFFGRLQWVKSLMLVSQGIGMLAGMSGLSFKEYESNGSMPPTHLEL